MLYESECHQCWIQFRYLSTSSCMTETCRCPVSSCIQLNFTHKGSRKVNPGRTLGMISASWWVTPTQTLGSIGNSSNTWPTWWIPWCQTKSAYDGQWGSSCNLRTGVMLSSGGGIGQGGWGVTGRSRPQGECYCCSEDSARPNAGDDVATGSGDGPVGVCWRAQKARGLGSKETTVKPFSRGPLTQKRRSNLDRIHMDSLIWIKMQVETTFWGGFDPHLTRIKDGGMQLDLTKQ